MIWNGHGVSRFNPVVRSVIASPQNVGQKKGLKYAKTRKYTSKPAFRLAPRNNKVSSESSVNPTVPCRRFECWWSMNGWTFAEFSVP